MRSAPRQTQPPGRDLRHLALLRYFAIRRSPGEFVWVDGSSDDPVVGSTEINQPFFVLIHQSTPMCQSLLWCLGHQL